MAHKAGFVNIIGKPNAGKSTLMNQLVGEKLSIITPKAQTTRHRILGIVNGDDYQIIFSDTPGILKKTSYKLHQAMMRFVNESLEDADIILYLVDISDAARFDNDEIIEKLKAASVPVLVLINKIDLKTQAEVTLEVQKWKEIFPGYEIIPVSALHGANVSTVFEHILELLPESPPYFPKDEYSLTDKPERFFVAEIIREKIFNHYREEVPYSVEVVVESFKEEENLVRIQAIIYVEKKSQKPIIIGKGGSAIKQVGIEARQDIERFLGKKVYLELYVKVREGWRNNPNQLQRFGYPA